MIVWLQDLLMSFPEKFLEKNSFFDESNDESSDFEFNQDIDSEEEYRSPGWIRYQKRIK